MGRYDLAIADYTKAISLNPINVGLFAGRGKIFVKAGKLNEAVADFTHALDMDMNMTAALRERGLAYKLLGNFDAARDDLNLFLPIQPNDEEIVQALKDMAPKDMAPTGRSSRHPNLLRPPRPRQTALTICCSLGLEMALRIPDLLAWTEAGKYNGSRIALFTSGSVIETEISFLGEPPITIRAQEVHFSRWVDIIIYTSREVGLGLSG